MKIAYPLLLKDNFEIKKKYENRVINPKESIREGLKRGKKRKKFLNYNLKK